MYILQMEGRECINKWSSQCFNQTRFHSRCKRLWRRNTR